MVLRTIRLRTTLLLGGSATARRDHVPYGLAGGRAGTPSRNVLNPGTEERELPAKCTLTVRSGDVYRHELAGGWGDPFARDPERVRRPRAEATSAQLTAQLMQRLRGMHARQLREALRGGTIPLSRRYTTRLP